MNIPQAIISCYLYALAIKVPLGTWLLLALAIGLTIFARGVNEAGVVCGSARDAMGNNYAWYFTDSLGMQPLLPGTISNARAINEFGMILGVVDEIPKAVYRVIPGEALEFFYSDSGYIDALDMNNSGMFAGTAGFMVEYRHEHYQVRYRAIRHDGSEMLDLGAGDGSFGSALNDAGDVVSTLASDRKAHRVPGFVYLNAEQTLVKLDDVVTGSADDLAVWFDDLSQIRPTDINESGQIAGLLSNSYLLSESQSIIGFLLTPVTP